MRYATGAKMLGCTVVGATLLLGGAGALGGLDMAMAQSSLLPVETMQRNAVDYDKVANVSGDFTFCQDVVTPADEVPEVQGPDDEYRAKVNILSTVDGGFKVGDMVSFEGYADDCGVKVASVEFSMDGGETWTSFDASSSNAEDWVYWHFDYVAETAGTFKLDVRAVTEDGTVSPLASSVVFDVEA